jgi:hypothetical protein
MEPQKRQKPNKTRFSPHLALEMVKKRQFGELPPSLAIHRADGENFTRVEAGPVTKLAS